MGKKLWAGFLVIIILIALWLYLQYGVPQEPLTESQAKDIIKDRYPGVGDEGIDIEHQDECEVCDEWGCRIIEDCWTGNFTEGNTNHDFVIGGSGGLMGGGGGIVEDIESPCTEWWCTGDPCVYTYVEIIPNGTITHYNTGCDNPEPACDQQHEKCRECNSPEECIRRTITVSDIGTGYYYDIIGVDAWGSINDTGYLCTVFDDGGQVFSNVTTIEECESIMASWSKCYGECDFEPTFGMIPP